MCLISNFLTSQHLDVPSLWISLKSGFLFLFPLRHPIQKIQKHPCFSSVNKFDIWYRGLDKLPNSILEFLQSSFKHLHVWSHKHSYTSWLMTLKFHHLSIPPISCCKRIYCSSIMLMAWLGTMMAVILFDNTRKEKRDTRCLGNSGDMGVKPGVSRDNWVYP